MKGDIVHGLGQQGGDGTGSRMQLDPFLSAKLDLIDALRVADRTDPDALHRIVEFERDPDERATPHVTVYDRSVPGRHGDVPVRIYAPRTPGGALLWLHGGAFLAGDLDMPEAHVVAAELASRTEATVVSVGYRLAIDGVHFPVPVDDVHDVWLWMLQTRVAPPRAMAMGGASVGATLALTTALRLRDRPAPGPSALLLAYPFAHFPAPPPDEPAAHALTSLPPMLRSTAESIAFMVHNYVGFGREIPRAALPGGCDLDRLPPSHIIISELDDLRPSGELLIDQLRRDGVQVDSYLAVGMPHGHLNHHPSLGQADQSLSFLARGLSEVIHRNREGTL